ncbi:MAG: dTMP kinase [Elusimicrobiota bacterium]
MKKGVFIVLEGADKSGKSTQALRLARELRAGGTDVVHTREPGGTSFAEAVRKVLLDTRHSVHPLAELLLYEASRVQHTEEVLRPALAQGAVVLCERYTLSTLAYQGCGRGLPLPMVQSLNRIATSGLQPDLTVVLDVPDSCLRSRDPKRKLDRLEREASDFHARVRAGYRSLAKRLPRTVLIDSDRPIDEVYADLHARVERVLADHGPSARRSRKPPVRGASKSRKTRRH